MKVSFKKKTDISDVAYLAVTEGASAAKSSVNGDKSLSEIGIDGHIKNFMFDFEIEGVSKEQKDELLRCLEEEYTFCAWDYIELFGELVYLQSTRLIPSDAVLNAQSNGSDPIYDAIDQYIIPFLNYKNWVFRISDGSVREMPYYPLNRYAIKAPDGNVYWSAQKDNSGMSNDYTLMRLSSSNGDISIEALYEGPSNLWNGGHTIVADGYGNVFVNSYDTEEYLGVMVRKDGTNFYLTRPEVSDGILKVIDNKWYWLVQDVEGYYPSIENIDYRLYRLDFVGQDHLWSQIAQYHVDIEGVINAFTAGDFHKNNQSTVCVGLEYCVNSEWYVGIIDIDLISGQGSMRLVDQLDFRICTRAYDIPGYYEHDIYGQKNYYLDNNFVFSTSDILTGQMSVVNLQKPADVILRNGNNDFKYYSNINAYKISASVKEDASNAVVFVYCDTGEVSVVYCGALETETLTRIN